MSQGGTFWACLKLLWFVRFRKKKEEAASKGVIDAKNSGKQGIGGTYSV
jgi:hypothetical protein